MYKTAITALLAALVISFCGCAIKEEYGAKILRTSFYPLSSGLEVAEVWVEAPDETCVIKGDTAQDVVYLEHAAGKMALPERLPVTDLMANGVCETGGYAKVAVYHLVLDEKEISYYKRRFAREANTGQ